MSDLLEHDHSWNLSAHGDGCHWHTTTATCDCGAILSLTVERDLKEDPYSMAWMDGDHCERCRELIDGAEPQVKREVVPA